MAQGKGARVRYSIGRQVTPTDLLEAGLVGGGVEVPKVLIQA
jgi:hypothetical protein